MGNQQVQAVATRQNIKKIWHLDLVRPETFIVNATATCLEDARIIGTVETMRIYDAALMGLDPDELIALRGSTDESSMANYERDERTTYIVNENEPDADEKDPMSDELTVAEVWLRIDADGDGVAELRHIITGGSNYEILVDEPVNFVPLGIFKTDLAPHVFFPISLAEDLIQDQDAQTALLRSIIDNTALVNNPRTAFNETMVNAEDMKNSEIGAMIRTKGPGQIEELATPFVAGQTLPVLQYLEEVSEKRSGITKMSQGLDPDALQSTTKIAANAAVMGGDARMEMMARNAGETGIKSMFLAIVRTAMNELRGPQSVRTMSGYQDVLPDIWHDQVGVSVNVGLGNGQLDSRIMALTKVAQVQQQAMMMLGLGNPICGWEQFRNTQKQLLRLAGEKSIKQYFPAVPPEMLAQIDQQQAQKAQAANQQPGAPDVVGAAKAKAEADIQINQAKLGQEAQIKSAEIDQKGKLETATLIQKGQITDKQLQAKLESDLLTSMLDDDRDRDKQAADFAVQSKKVELDNATKQQVAKEQAKQRSYPGNGSAKQ
jgi:lysophospholipase L1-like esterase